MDYTIRPEVADRIGIPRDTPLAFFAVSKGIDLETDNNSIKDAKKYMREHYEAVRLPIAFRGYWTPVYFGRFSYIAPSMKKDGTPVLAVGWFVPGFRLSEWPETMREIEMSHTIARITEESTPDGSLDEAVFLDILETGFRTDAA